MNDELLPIRRVAEETGLSESTLRAWERRYGRPRPERLPSGQRRYSWSEVLWLRQVAELVSRGQRPSELIPLPEDELKQRREETLERPEPFPGQEEAFEMLKAFDAEGLRALFLGMAEEVDAATFLDKRIHPFLVELGQSWAEGRLAVRHEHFATDLVREILVLAFPPLPETGPPDVLLGALPGERHGTPLLMASSLCRSMGVTVRNLGVDVPEDELIQAVIELEPRILGVTVSLTTGGAATDRQLSRLAQSLPAGVQLVAGGSGTGRVRRGSRSVMRFHDLKSFGDLLTDLTVGRRARHASSNGATPHPGVSSGNTTS